MNTTSQPTHVFGADGEDGPEDVGELDQLVDKRETPRAGFDLR